LARRGANQRAGERDVHPLAAAERLRWFGLHRRKVLLPHLSSMSLSTEFVEARSGLRRWNPDQLAHPRRRSSHPRYGAATREFRGRLRWLSEATHNTGSRGEAHHLPILCGGWIEEDLDWVDRRKEKFRLSRERKRFGYLEKENVSDYRDESVF
jgi:hypothetical protein